MFTFVLFAFMWIVIVFAWLIPVIRKGLVHEMFEALGLGGFFSLLILGADGMLSHYNVLFLKVLGVLLFPPAGFFVVSALVSLKRKGKPKAGWEGTTELVKSDIYSIVRHPLYLGTAIFAIAFVLLFQSIPSILIGIACIVLFWMASTKEDQYNIEKFGDGYVEYMKKVPMWNFFKGMMK